MSGNDSDNEQQQLQTNEKEDDGDWGKAFTRHLQKTISSIFDNNNSNHNRDDENEGGGSSSNDEDSGISITSSTEEAAQLVLTHAAAAAASADDDNNNKTSSNDVETSTKSLQIRETLAQAELSRSVALEEIERAKALGGGEGDDKPLQEESDESPKESADVQQEHQEEQLEAEDEEWHVHRQLLPPPILLVGDDLVNDAVMNDSNPLFVSDNSNNNDDGGETNNAAGENHGEEEEDVVDRIFNEQENESEDPLYETERLFRDIHDRRIGTAAAIVADNALSSSNNESTEHTDDAAIATHLVQQIASTNSADDYTEGSAWTDDQDSSSMYSSPSEYTGSPVHSSPIRGASGSTIVQRLGEGSINRIKAAGDTTSAATKDEEKVEELYEEEEEEEEALLPEIPNVTEEANPVSSLQPKSGVRLVAASNENAATDPGDSNSTSIRDDNDAQMIMIDEEAGETSKGQNSKRNESFINSILNPPGPRDARQKRERSLVILVVSLVCLSIVIAATVGGILGSRGNGGGGIEKSEPPTISPVTTTFLPTSFPVQTPPPNGAVIPPTAPTTKSPSASPTVVTPPPTSNPIETITPTIPICYNVDIIINYDAYPEDVSWTITQLLPPSNNTIVDQSPMGDPNQSRTVCLQRGFYNFTIYDDYGDGICCEWGNGNYTLIYQGSEGEEEGKVIAQGGVFNASESSTFPVGYVLPLI